MHLTQSTAKGSHAPELAESCLQKNKNYPLAKESLKSFFGKDELLIEI